MIVIMEEMLLVKFISIVIFGYLVGSIPTGVIIGKLVRGIDVRDYGSGKMGGTNVMRTLGTKLGILVIALDVAKAAVAVTLAKIIFGEQVLLIGTFLLHWQIAQVATALAVIVGHNWPVFLHFRGGRGVACFFGGLLAMSPAAALFGFQILLLVVFITRYMSMGSIFGAFGAWSLLAPMTVINQFPPTYLVYGLIAAALILYQHRDNISRLRAGTERRLGKLNLKNQS